MADTLARIGRSLIQHGPESDRVYGMKLAPDDMPEILDELESIAREKDYGKLFIKAQAAYMDDFQKRGYRQEARVPHFFGPGEDGVFMGKYLDPDRMNPENPEGIREVLRVSGKEVMKDPGDLEPDSGPGQSQVREATPADAEILARCYGRVFDSYPFPIHDPDHLRREQEGGTRFFTVWEGDDLVAASSMEPGGAPGAVEMTDFATLPSHRGQGLATALLSFMDRAAERAGERVAYTIARALSFGMNITFARRGYSFSGTLVNNTQIGGDIESMNVWYKVLSTPTTSRS